MSAHIYIGGPPGRQYIRLDIYIGGSPPGRRRYVHIGGGAPRRRLYVRIADIVSGRIYWRPGGAPIYMCADLRLL